MKLDFYSESQGQSLKGYNGGEVLLFTGYEIHLTTE